MRASLNLQRALFLTLALVFVLGVWVMWSLAVQRGIPDEFADIVANFSLVFPPNGELYFRAVVFFSIVLVASIGPSSPK